MNRTHLTRNTLRTMLAIGLTMILSACSPDPTPAPDTGHKFTIETGEIVITVKGDPALFEKHGGELLERITSVDPKLIKPGVGLWVEQDSAGQDPPLLLVGRVVAVEPAAGGYFAPAAPTQPPKE